MYWPHVVQTIVNENCVYLSLVHCERKFEIEQQQFSTTYVFALTHIKHAHHPDSHTHTHTDWQKHTHCISHYYNTTSSFLSSLPSVSSHLCFFCSWDLHMFMVVEWNFCVCVSVSVSFLADNKCSFFLFRILLICEHKFIWWYSHASKK